MSCGQLRYPGGEITYAPVVGVLFFIFLLIAGCATNPTKPNVVKTIITEPVINSDTLVSANFSLSGRISIQDKNQRVSGSLRWQHTELNDEIILLSPFGQTIAKIKSDHNNAYLTTSEQEIYYASDVEALTKEILGWHIPLTGLQFWAQGDHSPTTVAVKDIDSDGRVITIRQDGWEINYPRYFSATSSQADMPKVVALNYDQLIIKLVIDSWNFE